MGESDLEASRTPPIQGAARSKATIVLALGIVSVACLPLLGPVAWRMGSQELRAIRAGLVSSEDEGLATAGKVLGIIGTMLLGVALLLLLGSLLVYLQLRP